MNPTVPNSPDRGSIESKGEQGEDDHPPVRHIQCSYVHYQDPGRPIAVQFRYDIMVGT